MTRRSPSPKGRPYTTCTGGTPCRPGVASRPSVDSSATRPDCHRGRLADISVRRPAHGARFWAQQRDGTIVPMGGETPTGPMVLRLRLPEPAELSALRDGALVHAERTAVVDLDSDRAGRRSGAA